MLELPKGTKEKVTVQVASDDVLNTGTVEISLTAISADEPGAFTNAAWVTGVTNRLEFLWNTVDLTEGVYSVWVRVTIGTEVIIREAGAVRLV